MVGAHEAARRDLSVASGQVLALLGVNDPTIEQESGARIVAEFMLRVTQFLAPKE